MSKISRKAVPIPTRMKHLDLDKRGYPIPVMVQRDKEGLPLFTVNDEDKRQKVIKRDLCSICGKPLFRRRWFIGGPLSAFHENGTFIDPPVHEDCGKYAMMVCPYLRHDLRDHTPAIDNLAKRISDKAVLVNPTMLPGVPVVHVMIWAHGQTYSGPYGWVQYISPRRPFVAAEFWADAQRLPDEEGMTIVHKNYPGLLKPGIFKGFPMEDLLLKVLKDAA